MKTFHIYIKFSYSRRIREYSNYDDFTVESSDFVFRELSFDESHYWYNGHLCVDFKSAELRSDINDLCLRSLEFCGISRDQTLDKLSIANVHIIDLVYSVFEQIEKYIIELVPGQYLRSTGYFDNSLNPECVTVGLDIIEVESLKKK